MPGGDPLPLLLESSNKDRSAALPASAFLPLAVAALALRFLLAPWLAHSVDMSTFTAWGLRLAAVGPETFWTDEYWCDYLPGYLYLLWAAGELAALLPRQLHMVIFKMPSLLADLATAYLLWRLLRPTVGHRKLWLPAL